MFPFYDLNPNDALTFFCVLMRFSVLLAILPFVGDQTVPVPVKILLSLAISVVLYPVLKLNHLVNPADAAVWSSTVFGLVTTLVKEVVFGISLGFVAKITFDFIAVGGDMIGHFMGFASASQYDPHQETQTQIVSRFLFALGMLTFLAMDGHHLMLSAALDSYRIVPVGGLTFNAKFSDSMVQLTGELLRTGMRMAAPMAVSFFTINIIYGIMSKAMPQLNILVLSFSISAVVGFSVLFLSLPEMNDLAATVFSDIGRQMNVAMVLLSGR